MTAGLPWARLDSNIAHHDKTLAALGRKGGRSAMLTYLFALGWAVGHGTDGHIPRVALGMLHGTAGDARTLEEVGLWDTDPDGDGWWIHNFAQRQETSDVTDLKRAKARAAAERTNCLRWHGKSCGCWQNPPAPVRKVR